MKGSSLLLFTSIGRLSASPRWRIGVSQNRYQRLPGRQHRVVVGQKAIRSPMAARGNNLEGGEHRLRVILCVRLAGPSCRLVK
jgi:hypothetical protein